MDLKRSWLAKKLAVDPKTITRWCNGKVKRMTKTNAVKLAECLECSLDDITDKNDIHFLGTNADKEETIEDIISQDLLLLLSPTGNWSLLEKIIKSSISPNLKKDDIGKLYNWLSITRWRMGDYEAGLIFAEKAKEIGREIKDKSVYTKALFNIGTIYSMTGRIALALETLQECLKKKNNFTKISDVASLYTNLSMVYRDFGAFEESLHYQKEAIKLFENKNFNLAIAYHCLGYIYTEMFQLDQATENYEKAMMCAEKSNYENGKILISIYKLDVLSLSNQLSNVNEDMLTNINEFLQGDFKDPYCYECIARYYRKKSNLEKAWEVFEIGEHKAENNPIGHGALFHEAARIALVEKDFEKERYYRQLGNEIYEKLGINKRICKEVIMEYGKQEKLCYDVID
nr:tetratricopeptide repeat protein [Alkaliphilus hydrothermalis]